MFNKKYSVAFRRTYEYQPFLSLPNLKARKKEDPGDRLIEV